MEAYALGPARRGRRRTRAAGSLLSRAAILLFISAFLVQVPSSGEGPRRPASSAGTTAASPTLRIAFSCVTCIRFI
ncbi:ZPBP isoform 4 [Pan troglodytes]|uniref:ZPBP isoform 4 n=1 Tax=Pan troglodytes TaxID=9598 RepID=A0A2J8L926_PANTR|nr:ZPBP isoform 4 [Pan troglodytes]